MPFDDGIVAALDDVVVAIEVEDGVADVAFRQSFARGVLLGVAEQQQADEQIRFVLDEVAGAQVAIVRSLVLEIGNEAQVNTGYIWVDQENLEEDAVQAMLYE